MHVFWKVGAGLIVGAYWGLKAASALLAPEPAKVATLDLTQFDTAKTEARNAAAADWVVYQSFPGSSATIRAYIACEEMSDVEAVRDLIQTRHFEQAAEYGSCTGLQKGVPVHIVKWIGNNLTRLKVQQNGEQKLLWVPDGVMLYDMRNQGQ